MKRAIVIGSAAAVLALAGTAGGLAQGSYPNRPAQIVVPFPPGGNTDILTRVMADQYTTALKQPFTVVNKPGAGANIGAGFVANSDPDGYTLLMAPPATHAINAYLYNSLPFDMEKSFAPITMVARRFPTCWWCTRRSASKPIQELIAKAKAEPGKIDYATSGVGSTSHLCISLFMAMAGIEMNHIPYKGTSQSLHDVITGRVPVMIDNLGPILPHIQSGTLLALGVSTAGAGALLPGVPPVGKRGAGLPGELVERAVGAGARRRKRSSTSSAPRPTPSSQARRDREIPLHRLGAGRRHAGRGREVLRRGARALEARRRGGEAAEDVTAI